MISKTKTPSLRVGGWKVNWWVNWCQPKNWLALPVGNEGPSTFTWGFIGDETSIIPYESGQLENRGKTTKMDGENNGKPYEQMDD